ncbi:MAG: hypothetical protein [Bacteriophage sp.]|nr:MAG: hypothetical protein [Bacteriophage sp.]
MNQTQKNLIKSEKVFNNWVDKARREARIKQYDESETVKELAGIKKAFIKQFKEVTKEFDIALNEFVSKDMDGNSTDEDVKNMNYLNGKKDALLELQTKIMNGDY